MAAVKITWEALLSFNVIFTESQQLSCFHLGKTKRNYLLYCTCHGPLQTNELVAYLYIELKKHSASQEPRIDHKLYAQQYIAVKRLFCLSPAGEGIECHVNAVYSCQLHSVVEIT